MEKTSVLIVDDDRRLRDLLKRYLTSQGFFTVDASGPKEAMSCLEKNSFDLMILDVMMPEETGLAFMARLRSSLDPRLKTLPVLMLTALGEVDHRIQGLESGVDDYLTKPFDPKELVLRVQMILRRIKVPFSSQERLSIGSFEFDLTQRCLWQRDQLVPLTSTEATLLYVLATPPNQPVSRYDLAEKVGEGVSPRTVDVQIARLRRKIEPLPHSPQFIQTVRHQGYILRI